MSSSICTHRPFNATKKLAKLRNKSFITCSNSTSSQAERTKALRTLLQKPGILLGPAVYDGISAKLTEEAGFPFAFMSGFSVAGGRLAKPDTGLLSYGEILDQGRSMHEATNSIPIIGDGDTGYGNALNVKRTVKGYATTGFAGILIEDQMWPKSCGHVRGKRVVDREEAISRIKAAVDARNEGQDIVLVARTDARQAVSFEEAMYRAAAFADAGADIVFVDALETVAEMRTLCADVPNAYKMANMLEGGGKTPILTPQELEEMGFKICAYPLSLLGVSIVAMRKALVELKQGKVPVDMLSFKEMQSVLGFDHYFAQEDMYALQQVDTKGGIHVSSSVNTTQNTTTNTTSTNDTNNTTNYTTATSTANTTIEPDMILEPGNSDRDFTSPPPTYDSTVDIMMSGRSMDDLPSQQNYSNKKSGSASSSQWLRVKVTDSATGSIKLDLKFPFGFLGNIAQLVPQLTGRNLDDLFKGVSSERKGGGAGSEKKGGNEATFSIDADGDRIDFYLE